MSASLNYPKFAQTGPSGETLYEFRKAQNALNGGSAGSLANGGVVNNGFIGSDAGSMYLHAQHSDENEASTSSGRLKGTPRRTSSSPHTSNSDVDPYKPPSSSYGLSSNSSFKRIDNPQMKKQPRTQLAVPPCRPELPPRDSSQPKLTQRSQNSYIDSPPSAQKDKTRNSENNLRTMSSPAYDYNPNGRVEDLPPYREPTGNGNYPLSGFSYDATRPTAEGVNLNGSMEKISRV